MQPGHKIQEDWEKMSNYKVRNKNLDKSIILLFFSRPHVQILEPLELLYIAP